MGHFHPTLFFRFWPVSSFSLCCLSQLTQILHTNNGRARRHQSVPTMFDQGCSFLLFYTSPTFAQTLRGQGSKRKAWGLRLSANIWIMKHWIKCNIKAELRCFTCNELQYTLWYYAHCFQMLRVIPTSTNKQLANWMKTLLFAPQFILHNMPNYLVYI